MRLSYISSLEVMCISITDSKDNKRGLLHNKWTAVDQDMNTTIYVIFKKLASVLFNIWVKA